MLSSLKIHARIGSKKMQESGKKNYARININHGCNKAHKYKIIAAHINIFNISIFFLGLFLNGASLWRLSMSISFLSYHKLVIILLHGGSLNKIGLSSSIILLYNKSTQCSSSSSIPMGAIVRLEYLNTFQKNNLLNYHELS